MQWALVFDVDGIVPGTEVLNAKASVMMFERLYGTAVRPEDFREFVGTGDERCMEGVAEKYGLTIETEAAFERRRENSLILLQNEALPAMDGVLDLVEAARMVDGCLLAIATSGKKNKQFPVNDVTALNRSWFDAVITGDDVTRKKPDPQIYLVTAERLGIEPACCVVFEDVPAGVEVAKAGGLT